MWADIDKAYELLRRLNGLTSLFISADGIVTHTLQKEIEYNAQKWINEINKSFDKYILKQANIRVLENKKDELNNSED